MMLRCWLALLLRAVFGDSGEVLRAVLPPTFG
jgi:hypothetical protein